MLGSDTIEKKGKSPLTNKGPTVKVSVTVAGNTFPHQRQPLLPYRLERGHRNQGFFKDFILRRFTALNMLALGNVAC